MNNPIPVSEYHKGYDHARKATIAEVRRRVEDMPVLGMDLGVSGSQWVDPRDVLAILKDMGGKG